MNRKHLLAVAFCVLAPFGMVLPAKAQIQLRFDPPDTAIAVDHGLRLSIVLDAAQAVRSFEVWLQYDSAILTIGGGEPGLAFVESGCQLFSGSEEDTSGMIHAYVVILGADCWVTGPGELFAWQMTGSALGVSEIRVDNVALYAPQVGQLADVSLGDAVAEVFDPLSGVEGQPPASFALGDCYPNPFNPMTTISYDLPARASVRLRIYDVAGQLVKTLVDGEMVEAGRSEAVWRGRDESGRLAAAGLYFYRLEAGTFIETKRMTLVK